MTAGLDHVTSTGLPFEVSAENPGAKCPYSGISRRNTVMQKTANENVAGVYRICKRSGQPKIHTRKSTKISPVLVLGTSNFQGVAIRPIFPRHKHFSASTVHH